MLGVVRGRKERPGGSTGSPRPVVPPAADAFPVPAGREGQVPGPPDRGPGTGRRVEARVRRPGR
ncbi:hypothetical protein GCM10023079_37450 [Streptomyces chitinivorans]